MLFVSVTAELANIKRQNGSSYESQLDGRESLVGGYPTPDELWARYRAGMGRAPDQGDRLLLPYYRLSGKTPYYYQELAMNRTVEAILKGQRRVLLTMATRAGKTVVAFQICWVLWNAKWYRTGDRRRPKILFLADRNFLVDKPQARDFASLDARQKIEHGQVVKSREMYFAIYQALAEDERRPGLYKEYAPDFFDLIIVDECHRGSARDDSSWREILEYFEPAYQIGMTATPKNSETANNYRYFGDPIYTSSLRQGIGDGFLAPYRVHRIVTTVDAAGWRPNAGELDKFGRPVPDEKYQTKDFDRVVALRARTRAIARHPSDFMKRTDRFAKTIVFCVDQEHAGDMRHELNRQNEDLVAQHPNYVCRVTSDEAMSGRDT
jgi:type I restriction enzyme R subunit